MSLYGKPHGNITAFLAELNPLVPIENQFFKEPLHFKIRIGKISVLTMEYGIKIAAVRAGNYREIGDECFKHRH